MALGTLTVNEKGDGFLCDGKPWFWLADTCWSAFTSITLEDWDYYLARRAEQGINTLQINTLPQWDRCRPDLGIYPYASENGTVFDWSQPNPAYWERARTMCRMAVEHGIRPALVLMWCNYVPGTWGAAIAERTGATTMPLDEVVCHVRRVVEYLDEFDPVYVVTGDTDWKADECLPYYESALATVRELAPTRLRTMHINRANRTVQLPQKAAYQLRALLRDDGREPPRVRAFQRRELPRLRMGGHPCRRDRGRDLRCPRHLELADIAEPWLGARRGL